MLLTNCYVLLWDVEFISRSYCLNNTIIFEFVFWVKAKEDLHSAKCISR